jgi:hypothetical protein
MTTPHTVATDPGTDWVRDTAPAIEPSPDAQVNPPPEARWPTVAERTGVYVPSALVEDDAGLWLVRQGQAPTRSYLRPASGALVA